MTCIVCPIGCTLDVLQGDNIIVTGNKCPRGQAYAIEETRCPKRTVTATCHIDNSSSSKTIRRIPVKTSAPCPRSKIPSLLEDIYKIKVSLPVKTGDKVISNWNNLGIDIIATRSLQEQVSVK